MRVINFIDWKKDHQNPVTCLHEKQWQKENANLS